MKIYRASKNGFLPVNFFQESWNPMLDVGIEFCTYTTFFVVLANRNFRSL